MHRSTKTRKESTLIKVLLKLQEKERVNKILQKGYLASSDKKEEQKGQSEIPKKNKKPGKKQNESNL